MRKLGFGSIMHHEETSLDSKNGKVTSKISGKGEKSIKPTRKLKMDGFVAFNDDYHGPKHHLPKHN